MNNTIVANFLNNAHSTIASGLWQYDYGQILQIENVALPEFYEVHFSNTEELGSAKIQIGNSEGVLIPDEYLLTGSPIFAFIFLHNDDTDGETEYKIKMPVRKRPKPSPEEPTPEQQSVITQTIAAANSILQDCREHEQIIRNLIENIQNLEATAETLSPQENAYVEIEDGHKLIFGIPKGDKGDKGDTYELTPQDKEDIADLIQYQFVDNDGNGNVEIIRGI